MKVRALEKSIQSQLAQLEAKAAAAQADPEFIEQLDSDRGDVPATAGEEPCDIPTSAIRENHAPASAA